MTVTSFDAQQVLAQYATALDTRDFDLLSNIHTEDASWSFALGGQVIVGPLRGRDTIVEFAATPTEGAPARQRHVLNNLLSSDSTDTAVPRTGREMPGTAG